MIRTKIVATMGPATADVDALVKLFEAGADVCRLNFSHGALDGHLLMLRKIREAAARFKHPIAVLGDLGGPKIRLGPMGEEGDFGGLPIKVGDVLVLQRAPVTGHRDTSAPAETVDPDPTPGATPSPADAPAPSADSSASATFRVSTTLASFVDDVRVGDRILIEDGLLRFVCTERNYNEVRAACTAGGILKSAKGINLPTTPINVPSITDRDWQCIDWAIENDLDYLALSFVRHKADIELLRQHLANQQSDINVVAKIEKAEAIQEIDAIIEASDAVMVARGDLGVEMDLAEVPIIQKDLIRRCQTAGKPVIVATQMLQSMVEQSSPTRAEVSDVANAIFDGADAVMLSGETSVGKFPVGCVIVMSHIAEVTENYIETTAAGREPALRLKTMHLSAAMAKGVWQIVHDLKAKLVVIWSQTGFTARIFAKARFPVPIIALSTDHRTLRRMALHFGVVPQEMPTPRSVTDLVSQTDRMVVEQKYADPGDRIVIVSGASLGTPDTLDGVIVHTVGSAWNPTPGE